MKDWMIISPKGNVFTPINFENFHILGIVQAQTKEDAVVELKQNYHYFRLIQFDKIWVYPLESNKPFITDLTPQNFKDELNDEEEIDTIKRIVAVLKENYSDITFDYQDGDSFYFEGYSDAFQEIRVDLKGDIISVYDRYIGEKHYVHFGEFKV